MADSDFTIEEILLEAEQLKKEASGKAQAADNRLRSPAAESPASQAEQATRRIPKIVPIAAATQTISRQPEVSEETREIPPMANVQAAVKAVSARTRILYAPSATEQQPKPPVQTPADEQMTLDEFAPVHIDEPDEEPSDEELEEQLRQARQERVEGFRLVGGKTGLKLSGEEEDSEPDEALEPASDEDELEDYNTYEETEAVREELRYRRRMGRAGLVLTTLLGAALLAMTVLTYLGQLSFLSPTLLAGAQSGTLLVMMLINHRLVGGGLKRFFTLRADADSGAAVVSLGVLLLSVWQLYQTMTAGAAGGQPEMFTAVAGFGLWAGAMGKQSRIKRIVRNFDFVSREEIKHAALPISNEKAGTEIARAATQFGVTDVIYYRDAPFLNKFLEKSYAEDTSDDTMKRVVPLIAGLSLLGTLMFGAWTGDWARAATLFVTLLCLSMPMTALWNIQVPLTRSARKALQKGGMMIGWEAVEHYGEAQALVVDAAELFPAGAVRLHGIKTFADTRIDAALLDAAALVLKDGGPLMPVFERVIEGRRDILQEAESLAYEQERGLTGWVGGRRVLVGTRQLLENHGVEVPTTEYEMKFTKNDRRLVYLSVSGELSAMFVVSYKADEQVKAALDSLQREGMVLLVRTDDANITAALIAEKFGVDEDGIMVLSAAAGRSYRELTAGNGMPEEAVLAGDGQFAGKAYALTQCSRLRAVGKLAMVPLCIGGVLGVVCGSVLAMYFNSLLPPLITLGYTAFWGLLGGVLPLFRRV